MAVAIFLTRTALPNEDGDIVGLPEEWPLLALAILTAPDRHVMLLCDENGRRIWRRVVACDVWTPKFDGEDVCGLSVKTDDGKHRLVLAELRVAGWMESVGLSIDEIGESNLVVCCSDCGHGFEPTNVGSFYTTDGRGLLNGSHRATRVVDSGADVFCAGCCSDEPS